MAVEVALLLTANLDAVITSRMNVSHSKCRLIINADLQESSANIAVLVKAARMADVCEAGVMFTVAQMGVVTSSIFASLSMSPKKQIMATASQAGDTQRRFN